MSVQSTENRGSRSRDTVSSLRRKVRLLQIHVFMVGLIGLVCIGAVGFFYITTLHQRDAAYSCLVKIRRTSEDVRGTMGEVTRWARAGEEATETGQCRDGDMVVSIEY